jgi:glyoxylase-like metal-dependent hydrolase (beta-lactamase superfamily II)
MWDNKVVPPFNFNKEQSLASIDRIAKPLAEHKTQLWIGHDKDIIAKIDRAPKFYE